MVKHTQTIRRQFADELFECAWQICDIGALRVKDVKFNNVVRDTLFWAFNSSAYTIWVINWANFSINQFVPRYPQNFVAKKLNLQKNFIQVYSL